MRRLRAAASPAHLLLGLIVAAGLAVRLVNNDYGLPYVYNLDEASHFTNLAVEMFGGDYNPGYFQNPSAFTYLVHFALRLRYGDLGPIGPLTELGEGTVPRQFLVDPTPIWVSARAVAALVCMAAVVGVFFVGRRLWGVREGLVAAAILSFAFLPVAFSRVAVTDVGTMLPVTLAAYAAIRAYEDGGRRHFLLAGATAGLAVGFKYTSGLAVLPLLAAAALRLRRQPGERLATAGRTGLALLAAAAAFFATTPYFLLDAECAQDQLEEQAEVLGVSKFGEPEGSGFLYYLDSLTWGLGWAAAVLAPVGAALVLRRDRARGFLLLLFPLALFLYMGFQSRYFGRWLLPLYPTLALLAAFTLARAADLLRRGPALRAAALAALTVAVVAQSVLADVRTMRLLGREDTLQEARDFLVREFRPGLRIAAEPSIPPRYYYAPGQALLAARSNGTLAGAELVTGFRRRNPDKHASQLHPRALDRYRAQGYCVVMTTSTIRDRVENAGSPDGLAYYRRLERESELIFRADPYRRGARPVRFHFDFSGNYYPPAYERPGPEVRIYRLDRCRQGYGVVADVARRDEVTRVVGETLTKNLHCPTPPVLTEPEAVGAPTARRPT